MTREDIKADADAAVDEFAQFIIEQEQALTGIRRPPFVLEDVTELDLEPFDASMVPDPEAEAFPGEEGGGGGGGGGGGTNATGACCSGGGCTTGFQGDCGGTFYEGEDCVVGSCGGPPEPNGACCSGPTATCAITTFPECGGIYFGDGIPCDVVGSCQHAYCGPTNFYCGCHAPPWWPYGDPNPRCCVGDWDLCGACWEPLGQFYYCCCCRHTPFGWFCF